MVDFLLGTSIPMVPFPGIGAMIRIPRADNDRAISKSYTISSANTWEKKSMTFAGDTGVNAIVNDTGYGLMLIWYLAAGSNLQGGTNTNDKVFFKLRKKVVLLLYKRHVGI